MGANVVELIASEIVQGARRLSAVQAKRYTVSYEVVVPSTMSVDALIEKANRIAGAGSVESQVFRQVLTATDGVEQVSQVVIKIPAQVGQIEEIMAMSVDKTPTQTDEGKNWTALIIGAIAIVLAVTCLASSAVFLMRRRNADSKSAGNDRSATYVSAQVWAEFVFSASPNFGIVAIRELQRKLVNGFLLAALFVHKMQFWRSEFECR